MNTPGIEFGRKTSAAYAALCKPLCQKLHLPQTAFDILMFLANNPGYQTASDVVEVRKLKANLVSVNVDRLVHALRRKNIQIRDCPMPPPMVYGSSSLMIAFWKGRSFLSSQPAFFNWESRAFLSTRIPMEDNSNAISRTG